MERTSSVDDEDLLSVNVKVNNETNGTNATTSAIPISSSAASESTSEPASQSESESASTSTSGGGGCPTSDCVSNKDYIYSNGWRW